MTRYSLLALLAFLSVALTACGGGGGEAKETPITGQATSAAPATPMSTPIVADNLFEFPDRGYSVRFPEGWTPMPNFLPGPGFSVDVFFAPQETEGVQPNIAVTCEQVDEGKNLKDYVNAKVDIVKNIAHVEPEVSPREVSGQEAMMSRYARETNVDSPFEKTEVFFITERCGWIIALTAPYNERASYHDLFDEFVDSFRLLP
jgi:hypothetical protein